MLKEKVIQSTSSTSTLIDHYIVYFKIAANADITVKDLKEGRAANHKLTEGQDYCVLLESGLFTSFSKDVREAMALPEHAEKRIALALLVNNAALELLAKFYLKVNKPVGVTKIFKNKEAAIQWLQQKRDEHYAK